MRIAIIGGTGREGTGLSLRWALAGHAVFIGSRDEAKAKEKAAELAAKLPPGCAGSITGGDNPWAVGQADIALLSVPYGAHAATLAGLKDALAGRVLVDITVPLQPPRVAEVHVPAGTAAALEAQAHLGPQTTVVAALHHVSSAHLKDTGHGVDCDVLVAADDEAAKARVIGLVADLGMRGLDAGPLRNAVALEALTPVLLHLGRRHKVTGVGVRFTGIP